MASAAMRHAHEPRGEVEDLQVSRQQVMQELRRSEVAQAARAKKAFLPNKSVSKTMAATKPSGQE